MNQSLRQAAIATACLLMVSVPGATRADPLRCQRTINTAFARFINTKARIVKKCKDGAVRKGVPASPVDCPLTAQDEKINAAAQKMRDKIAKDCGGAHKLILTHCDQAPPRVPGDFYAFGPTREDVSPTAREAIAHER